MTEQRTITEADLERLAVDMIVSTGGTVPEGRVPPEVVARLRSEFAKVGISVEVPIPEPEGDVIVRDVNGDYWERNGSGWNRGNGPLAWNAVVEHYEPLTFYRSEADALTEVPDEKVHDILEATLRFPNVDAADVVGALFAAGIAFCERKGSDLG